MAKGKKEKEIGDGGGERRGSRRVNKEKRRGGEDGGEGRRGEGEGEVRGASYTCKVGGELSRVRGGKTR